MTVEPYRPQPIETFQTPEKRQEMIRALAEVRQQFGRHYPLIIGGEKVQTQAAIPSTNPSNPAEVVGYAASQ